MTRGTTRDESSEEVPEEAAVEEAPAEEGQTAEDVDPAKHDYHDVSEGVQSRVMTADERNLRARLG
jgi:hypothetical protein